MVYTIHRAVSVLCCGEDILHTELRVRTLCELVLNEEFYLQPSIVSILDPHGKEVSKRALIATSAQYDQALASTCGVDRELSRTILRLDCIETSKDGEYSNMWHVYGLASVFNRTITSIYPERNVRIRSLKKTIHPRAHRSDQSGVPLIILWTRTTEQDHGTWSPNHFVPCYVRDMGPSKVTTPACTTSSASTVCQIRSRQGHSSHRFYYSINVHVGSNTFLGSTKSVSSTAHQVSRQSGASPTPAEMHDLCHDNEITQPGQKAMPIKQQKLTPTIHTGSVFHFLSGKHQTKGLSTSSHSNECITKYFPLMVAPDLNSKSLQQCTPVSNDPSYATPSIIETTERVSSISTTANTVFDCAQHHTHSASAVCSSTLSSTSSLTTTSVSCGDVGLNSSTSQPTRRASTIYRLSSVQCHGKTQMAYPQPRSVSRILEATSAFHIHHHEKKSQDMPITKWFPTSSSNKSVYDFEGQHMQDFSKHDVSRTYSLTHTQCIDENDHAKPCLNIDCQDYDLTGSASSLSDSEEDYLMSYSFDDELQYNDMDVESMPESTDTSEMRLQLQTEPSHPLPFPCVSSQWYARQHRLSTKNAARERRRDSNSIHTDEDGNFTFSDRSRVQGNLRENLCSLRESAQQLSDGNKREHLQAIIAVGEYILENGPVVRTQDVGKLYLEQKGLTRKQLSIEYYELFSKYLNIVHVYMYGRAFVIQNSSNVQNIVKCLSDAIDEETVIKKRVEERLQTGLFKLSLQYMDSHRDRQVLKALVAELTNTKFVAKLQGIQSRKGVRNATKSLHSNLKLYANLRTTSQTVRSDLTTVQQYKLTERIISARKSKEIRSIAEGRGRKLKSKEFPELAAVLCYAFGEYDMRECGGGGLEAHPRLTTGTLYRSSDSATTMKKAREILLTYAPHGFSLSLSSCYNYTDNYRRGSRQARQHHFGEQGVNAQISLKKPPRTGVQEFVVNLHWSTANVNLLVDSKHDCSYSLVVSKDAKAIVPGDIAPVQRPGPTWKSRVELPDHTWDQSRTNAVTPMTFPFLMTSIKQLPATTVECLETQISNTTTIHLQ